MKSDEQNKALSKFTILCWAIFLAIMGHMWPMGRGLDTPGKYIIKICSSENRKLSFSCF